MANKFKFGSIVRDKQVGKQGVVLKAEVKTYLVAFEDGMSYWFNESDLEATQPSMYAIVYTEKNVPKINKDLEANPLHKVHSLTTIGDKVVVIYQS